MVYRTTANVYSDIDKTDLIFSTRLTQGSYDPEDPSYDTRKSISILFSDAGEELPCFIDKAYVYYRGNGNTHEIGIDDKSLNEYRPEYQDRSDERDIYFTYGDQEYSIEKIIQNGIPYNIRDDRVNGVEELLSEI